MYFEEKIIDGVLNYRETENGEWKPYTIEELSERVVKMNNGFTMIEDMNLDLEDPPLNSWELEKPKPSRPTIWYHEFDPEEELYKRISKDGTYIIGKSTNWEWVKEIPEPELNEKPEK